MSSGLQITLDFLRELRANNDRNWFKAHESHYKTARAVYERLINDLIIAFDTAKLEDFSGVTVKDCIFRINRDIRFAKDKSPYNSHMGAVVARGGRKPQGRSYYIHIQPDGE